MIQAYRALSKKLKQEKSTDKEDINMKNLFAVILALFLLCGCSQTEIPEENGSLQSEESSGSSSLPEQPVDENVWTTLRDFSGEKIDYENRVFQFSLDYVYAWNLCSDEYIKFEDPYMTGKEQSLFGYQIQNIRTVYEIPYSINDFAACVDAGYSLGWSEKTVCFTGVFAVQKNHYGEFFAFFPYYEEGKNMFFVHQRTEEAENRLKELEASLFELTGKEVQPANVFCRYNDENFQMHAILSFDDLAGYTGTDFSENVKYIEAAVYFSYLDFNGRSNANDSDIYETDIYGNISKIEIIEIH